jgi:lipopolysaccharide transport system permease protein
VKSTAENTIPAGVPGEGRIEPNQELPLTIIDGHKSWRWADLQELWRFRELFFYLTLRDIKLRYKQTILGLGWSVFQPLATIIVFVVFLGHVGKVAEGVPSYTVFVVCGILPWNFFANACMNGGNSLVNNERLVTKIYFPRLALPAANVFAAMFDFLICLAIFGVAGAAYGLAPSWNLLMVPVVVGFLVMFAMGFSTLMAALIVSQRDFRYILGFGIQLWMFATPCIYLPEEQIGPAATRWLMLNPVYGLILNFRASVLGTPFDWPAFALSASLATFALALGMIYFRRVDRTMADTI